MDRRNTIQRDMVLNAVRSLKCHATADEVYDAIAREYPSIGRGTVYRNLNILAEEGAIRRVECADRTSRFDHTTAEHYHVRCVKCNKVFDVDMEILPNLMDRISDRHGMRFLDYEIVFRGVCPQCQDEDSIV